MPGIIGATRTEGSLDQMRAAVSHEEWYETERFSETEGKLGLVHHGQKDPRGQTIWRGEHGVAVVYGVIPNREALDYDKDELFETLLDRPSVLLPKLDGPFALATLDRRDGSVTLAMDRLGTRPLYYAETDTGLVFSSELKAVLTEMDDAALDPAAVGDLLAYGYVIGEKTLVEDVFALQAGMMVRYEDGDIDVGRYWAPECGRLNSEDYPKRVLDTLRHSVRDAAGTIDDPVGLFLSGGLDSRLLAALLRDEYGTFHTFTYDSNPANGANLEPARQIAAHLDVDNERIDIRPGNYHEDIETAVDLTDGMTSWSYFLGLDFILHSLHDRVDVAFEAATLGELLGEMIKPRDLYGAPDATEALWRTFHSLDVDRVNELVNPDVDPRASLQAEVAKSAKTEQHDQVIDTWLRTVNPNSHYRNKNVIRSQVGMRLPFTGEEFVDTISKMPHDRYRQDAFPFTRGKIPRVMAPLKRDVVCELDADIAAIPYERTRLGVSQPMLLHEASFVGKELYWRFVTGRPGSNLTEWSRELPETRSAIQGWLEAAAERDVFDAEAIRDLSSSHFSGRGSHLHTIGAITAVELFCQKYLDASGVDGTHDESTLYTPT